MDHLCYFAPGFGIRENAPSRATMSRDFRERRRRAGGLSRSREVLRSGRRWGPVEHQDGTLRVVDYPIGGTSQEQASGTR